MALDKTDGQNVTISLRMNYIVALAMGPTVASATAPMKRKCQVIHIGTVNRLKFVRQNSFSAVFVGEDEEDEDVVLSDPPKSFSATPGDLVDIFVFRNSEEQLEATLERPTAMVGDFAFLKVVDVQHIGAFLDWGMPKDLFVPHHEQVVPMTEGYRYVVRLYIDNTGRIAASSKLDKFLKAPSTFEVGQEVNLLICEPTDLGFKAIVDGKNWGLLYNNEIFESLERGQQIRGYIKQLRSDDKIDLSLKKPRFEKNPPLLEKIIEHLQQNGGHSDITDKSVPDKIYQIYGVSKSQYKNALGMLYRQKRITIDKAQIALTDSFDSE